MRVRGIRSEALVPVADGGHRPGAHLVERLAIREAERRRIDVDGLPEPFASQLLERPAGPVAVADVAEPLVELEWRWRLASGGDRLGSLPAALERRADDRGQRDWPQSRGQHRHLGSARRVERDPRRPTDEGRAGERGQAVADEEDGGHGTAMIGESPRRAGRGMVAIMVHRLVRSAALSVLLGLGVLGCGSAPDVVPGVSPAAADGGVAGPSLAIAGETFRPTGPTEPARVVRIVDGDTIVVNVGGRDEHLRYIGMDTPETVKPGSPVEWMGPEASRANAGPRRGPDGHSREGRIRDRPLRPAPALRLARRRRPLDARQPRARAAGLCPGRDRSTGRQVRRPVRRRRADGPRRRARPVGRPRTGWFVIPASIDGRIPAESTDLGCPEAPTRVFVRAN